MRAALACLCWLASAGLARAAVVDRIAAVVNDEVLTLSEVYALGGEFVEKELGALGNDALRRELELEVLESLIQRRLISQEIERLGLDVSDDEVERTIDDIARRNGLDRKTLQVEIERSGMSWSAYRVELKENLRQARFSQAVIQPRISVNEDELKDAYRRLSAGLDQPQVAEVMAMFFAPQGGGEDAVAAARERAQIARARVLAGEDFAAVAAALDEGPFGASGGAMGTYRAGELVAELNGPVFSLPPGQVGEPVTTPQGVFLLLVKSRTEEAVAGFEAARDELFQQVYAARIEDETEQWTQQARRRAAVSIKLEPADSLVPGAPAAAPGMKRVEAAPAAPEGAETPRGDAPEAAPPPSP
jgi:peptidyl-prolyl cis-trans isomerase SurA